MVDRPTRQRIIDEAMRLFGEQGYAATSVAHIEAAAGLSSGAGGLYRHFSSKQALLEAGTRRQIESNRGLLAQLDAELASEDDLGDQLQRIAEAGIARLEQERDLNRLVVRDLRHFPDLLSEAGAADITAVHRALATWISGHDSSGRLDADALAAVLAGATSHFWLLRDVFGEHPTGVTQDRYLSALVSLVEHALSRAPDPPAPPD